GQSGYLTDLILLLGQPIPVLAYTEEALQRLGRNSNLEAFLGSMLPYDLATHLGDLPLQAAHARLPGVVADNVADSRFVELQLILLQAVSLGLLGHQIARGN